MVAAETGPNPPELEPLPLPGPVAGSVPASSEAAPLSAREIVGFDFVSSALLAAVDCCFEVDNEAAGLLLAVAASFVTTPPRPFFFFLLLLVLVVVLAEVVAAATTTTSAAGGGFASAAAKEDDGNPPPLSWSSLLSPAPPLRPTPPLLPFPPTSGTESAPEEESASRESISDRAVAGPLVVVVATDGPLLPLAAPAPFPLASEGAEEDATVAGGPSSRDSDTSFPATAPSPPPLAPSHPSSFLLPSPLLLLLPLALFPLLAAATAATTASRFARRLARLFAAFDRPPSPLPGEEDSGAPPPPLDAATTAAVGDEDSDPKPPSSTAAARSSLPGGDLASEVPVGTADGVGSACSEAASGGVGWSRFSSHEPSLS